MWIKLSFVSIMLLTLTGCGVTTQSEVDALDYANFDTSTVTGTWRFTAAYSFNPGEVSGVTANIIKGNNPTSNYLGLPKCDLIVQSADSDYQALRLPGLNGKFFNPCAFVGVIQHYLPPNGQGTVSKQFATGGSIDVFYNGNNFAGFKSSSEMGNMELRVGGSAGNQSFSGIPSNTRSVEPTISGSPSNVDIYSQGVPTGAIVPNGTPITTSPESNTGSVIPSEPEDFLQTYGSET